VVEFPDDLEMRVSHETIYQSLFVQSRGALRKELTVCLRTGRAQRRPKGRTVGRGQIPDMVMISDRPAEIEDRAVPGHWEGDLVRHEALFDRAVMKGHRRRDVAAARQKLRAA
jgi:IS30 family transposase